MSLKKIVIVCVFIFLAIASALCLFSANSKKPQSFRYLRYSFVFENTRNTSIDDLGITIFAPLESRHQIIKKLVSSHKFTANNTHFASQLVFKAGVIPPYSSAEISIDTEIGLKPGNSISVFENTKPYLKPEKFIPCDDPEIIKIAGTLKGKNKEETVNNILRWIKSEVAFSGYSGKRLGANVAIRNKKGDCTELMDVFLTLARACNIPARGISGFICDNDMMLRPDGYHNWAEYYDGLSWVGVDPSYGKTGESFKNYVIFRIFEPGYAGQGSLFEIPEQFKAVIKVRMNT